MDTLWHLGYHSRVMKITLPSMLDRQASRLRNKGQALRHIIGYLGPGFFVTVGFIDPGNWATNVAAGSYYGYKLLWVVVLGTAILILWQHMSAHLGVVTGKCLAESIRENVHKIPASIYGVTAMAAISATALAELLGAAIGLFILFRIPIVLGMAISAILSAAAIWFRHYSNLEKVIVALVSVVGVGYLAELYLVKPDWAATAYHLVVPELDSGSVLIAIGVLGAVVMPHNMYLHSEVIQNRHWQGKSEADTRRLLKYEFLDTLLAMLVGLAINAAMLIVSAAVFYKNGFRIDDLVDAAQTLRPLAGNLARLIFGVGLLLAGIASSVTAALSGGIAFTGFIGQPTATENKWFRFGVLLTLLPACLMILLINDTFKALIISQACLSIQLPLTMLPLFLLTNSKRVMGRYANGRIENGLMIVSGLIILALNLLLIYTVFGGKF